ncbi:MAG: hypothetical protein OEN50_01910 [Deltaproteobacteria bacterium]|nr:hypothetical protein [Deltaproteobacteria bacterium]
MNNARIIDTLFRFCLSTITFLVVFYATTIVMSYLYPLDSAILPF